MKNLFLLVLIVFCIPAVGQVGTYPLKSNAEIKFYLEEHPNYVWQASAKNKWGNRDTLGLPFFDDFSAGGIYPDSSRWLNNQVYMNRHFGKYPPTLGVVTFDVLDQKGNPYNGTLNKELYGLGDSLTSQPINLEDSLGTPYSPSDSIMFSFYYQANGYGYHLRGGDSLLLFFKNEFGNWIQVWSVGGQSESTGFEQVIIPIVEEGYLHKGFQFMFLNTGKQVGNAGHWNLDYVLLHSKRSVLENSYYEYAIQTEPTPLLKNYYEMPLSHFMVNPAAEAADSLYVRSSNMDKDLLPIQMMHEEYFDGTKLFSTTFSQNSVNTAPRGHALRRTDNYNFYSTLNSSMTVPLHIDRIFRVRNSGNINPFTANDSIHVRQTFYDHFAYDDGTAEQGFGYYHLTNPENVPGEVAYRFKLNKADTLYAIGTFFNQAVFDVSSEIFTLRVWQSIAVNGRTEDTLVYESEPLNPAYMDRINRFSIHYLDTVLLLDEGEFYIGWYQSSMYNLNVGWDRNSGNRENPDQTSQNLYYKQLGQWTNAGLPNGELMMRPFVGSSRTVYASVPEIQQESKSLQLYPNPASTVVNFGSELKFVMVLNASGQVVLEANNVSFIDVTGLSQGIYFVKGCDSSHVWLNSKLAIFAP